MRKYRYDTLQLAHRGKTVCAYCGKRTFVNYLYSDGTPVADGECGKCDRADNCGVHVPPREYFKNHQPLTSLYSPQIRKPQRQQPKPPSCINAKDMLNTLREYERNPLVRFLHSVFDEVVGSEIVDKVVERYAVGTSTKWGGATVYWQIDQYGRIRTGKVMGYNAANGKRIHTQNNYVHSILSDRYPNFNLEQCYFGSHLIVEAEHQADLNNAERRRLNIDGEFHSPIWLFESEKAAVIIAIALMWGGEPFTFIPMATSGCGNLNPTFEAKRNPNHKIQVLKNRKVVLFPDAGKFDDWKAQGEKLKGFCQEVYISTVVEQDLHPYKVDCEINDGDGFDDCILRYVANGKEIWNLICTCYGYHGQWKIV